MFPLSSVLLAERERSPQPLPCFPYQQLLLTEQYWERQQLSARL